MTRKGEARSVAQRLVVRLLDDSNEDHWLFRESWFLLQPIHLRISRDLISTQIGIRPHVPTSCVLRTANIVNGDGHSGVINFEIDG